MMENESNSIENDPSFTGDRSTVPLPVNSPELSDGRPAVSPLEKIQRHLSVGSIEPDIPLATSVQTSRASSPKPTHKIPASQLRSNLSLIIKPRPSEEQVRPNELKPISDRHVFFQTEPEEIFLPPVTWRERIDAILTKKRSRRDKYAHVKARVNSFANFDYRPKRIPIETRRSYTEPSSSKKANKTRKSFQFGRLQYSPNGTAKIFHQPMVWNSPSKLKAYSLENLYFNVERERIKESKWKSEPKLYEEPAVPTIPVQTVALPILPQIQKIEQQIVEPPSIVKQPVESSMRSIEIFDQRLLWTKKSKLKELIWQNINYTRKKSKVSRSRHNREELPLMTHRSLNDISLIEQPLESTVDDNKAQFWSESDIYHLEKNKKIRSQYETGPWKDLGPVRNERSKQIQDKPDEQHISKESPAFRPKWNTVSNTRSLNSVYNPDVNNANQIRRGWDFELKKKRRHRLPPLKRKPPEPQSSPLAIEAPTSNQPLAIEYHHDQTISNDYGTISSRRSSRRTQELQLVPITPHSQRPIQQEWYEEFNKTQALQKVDGRQTANQSVTSNTPRDQWTVRSSTRNSLHSSMTNHYLDPTIRTNRVTELRLARDLDEHHQHCHTVNQSMPLEIRGFQLEGTSLTVPDHATIRPLSNINYRASERVRNHRLYPWSNLHPISSSSRNSGLLPIEELRNSPIEMKAIMMPPLVLEE